MYQQYFGLSESPFSIAPDPRYLFLSNKHREALAHLIYGVGDQGGFVVLTGEVGTGKTTICRCLLQQIPENADVAYIINPTQSVNQLLQSIFNDLSVPYPKGSTSKDLIDLLNHYLLDAHARGRNTIVIIDEAQNLTSEVLEQLRLLTNLETNEKKLLQLVLLGQPELNALLSKPELRQLSQRVTARYHLSPLSRSEVTEYIGHRLSVAGCRSTLFSPSAIRRVYRLSQGVPRLINLICDRTLLGVYSSNSDQATVAIVNNAAKEVFTQSAVARPVRHWMPVAAAACMGVLIFVISLVWKNSWVGAEKMGAENRHEIALNDIDQLVQQTPPEAFLPVGYGTGDGAQAPASWLKRLQHHDDPKVVLAELYQLWRLSPGQVDVRDCLNTGSNSVAIHCRKAISTVSQLRAFNSPIVLSYKLGGDRLGYLLLKSLSGDDATIKVGRKQYVIPVQDLFNKLFSHSYLLTRIPENIELPIFPGDTGPTVSWLQTQLTRFDDGSSALKATQKVDENVAQGKNKFDFFYSYHLDFSNVLITENYDDTLQKQIMLLQKQLGMVGNAIVDVPLLVALNKTAFATDPTLYPQKQFNGFESATDDNKLSDTDNNTKTAVQEG
jgi:general secretion pathway protein A